MRVTIYIYLIILAVFISCSPESSLTGSASCTELSFVAFHPGTSVSVFGSSITATGTLTNSSSVATVTSPWNIEGQFYYQDGNGNDFVAGGASSQINNSLGPGISMEWALTLSTNNTDHTFEIRDLRACQ